MKDGGMGGMVGADSGSLGQLGRASSPAAQTADAYVCVPEGIDAFTTSREGGELTGLAWLRGPG